MYDISMFDNFDKLKIDVGSEGLYEKSMLEVRTNDLLFSCLGLVLRVVGAFIKFRSILGQAQFLSGFLFGECFKTSLWFELIWNKKRESFERVLVYFLCYRVLRFLGNKSSCFCIWFGVLYFFLVE